MVSTALLQSRPILRSVLKVPGKLTPNGPAAFCATFNFIFANVRTIPTTLLLFCLLLAAVFNAGAQTTLPLKFKNSTLYAGIDIGSRGVKLSVLEAGKNPQKSDAFHVALETSVNTDFISFTPQTFQATLNGLFKLYQTARDGYGIVPAHIYTVFSSGVVTQAEKEDKKAWMHNLADSFKKAIREPGREVLSVDVAEEARLSHLGIVPEAKRYSTFLIDIGSGNTKGGYFAEGNTKNLRLFQVTWGTKSVANATEKRAEGDKSLSTFNRQLYRVLEGEPNAEIVYAVNASGAYNMSDNIAVSGGIAWAVATLMYPELSENTVVPVTYKDVVRFSERLVRQPTSVSDTAIIRYLASISQNQAAIVGEVKRANSVFDHKSLMAGTGLLLRILRQFEGPDEKKQFYLVRNGQVGWITAYVKQTILNRDTAHEAK